MSSAFVDFDTAVSYVIPDASTLDGDDSGEALGRAAGDIVFSRNGQVLSVRSWPVLKRWSLSYTALSLTDIANMRAFWERRVFDYYTAFPGSPVRVYWEGDFVPQAISPTLYSLEVNLRQIVT